MLCNRIGQNCYAETDLAFLVSICDTIGHSKDLHNDLEIVLKKLCSFLDAKCSMITIIDRNYERMVITSSYGLTEEEINRGVYDVGEGIVGKVARGGIPVVIPDIAKDPKFLNKMGIEYKDGQLIAFICVPIIIEDEIMGTLSIHKVHSAAVAFFPEVEFLNIVGMLVAKNVSICRNQMEELEELRRENQRLKDGKILKPDNIVGNSALMRDLYGVIERVAPTNTTVMIRGESGVGKELIAEAIHNSSSRKLGPFIKVNCSALPENLIESELFGHEKGSFTGASALHIGRFEMANRGTIFLDEIGDVPLTIQVKLLRVLQERKIERIGGSETIDIDVRIIAATNRNLEELIKENTFREDFYYRINVFSIYVPALRERCADIPMLVDHFIAKLNNFNGTNIKRITGGALDMLMVYSWPGNIRELENVIEQAMILSTDNVIHSYNLPPTLQTAVSSNTLDKGSLNNVLSHVEKQMIVDTLILKHGSVTNSAKQLGITRRVMGLLINKYKIEIKKYKHLSDEDNTGS